MKFPLRRFAAPFLLFVLVSVRLEAAEPFPIETGDRVLLIGDTLIERENTFGYLEARLRAQFAEKKFTVRNLGFSADSPLGISRTSFDPAAKGVERLNEQLELVKPTVAIVGYGMGASLEELTYRHNDSALNPDPVRYGTEHDPAQFKRDLGKLMDLISQSNPGGKVRFVLLGPIQHEDLRAQRPGMPDPAEHNQLLGQYRQVIEELAKERGARYVAAKWDLPVPQATDNGIHLNALGYQALGESFAEQLGWGAPRKAWNQESPAQAALRRVILRKNELFFHRWRPANYTYLLGFRKHEQGRNAAEIPKFDPLIDQAEEEIFGLSSGKKSASPMALPEPVKLAELPAQPLPEFTLADGLEITLYAENPLLEKPVQMNWDAEGRLWVASSNTYPQVNPEDIAAAMAGDASKAGFSSGNDKILILEDRNHDGKAESSRIFAGGLLIPTAVAPDNAGGCYVGASTELLLLGQPGADGQATSRRIVLSGFGTEDTHHIVHTLHWGIDGRLYFHQSIYIHTHMETPWGVVRANAGAVFAYDPKTERIEVFARGLWNTWGQQENRFGQSFLTDGAGRDGISWAFPGAVFAPSEGARRNVGSVSPGSYPKFCGLELIDSPNFPSDWQGSAITCDFRAHRIVRFEMNDLTSQGQSGYVTKDMPDVVRTSDMSFRPIDVRLGPDGALYVADWSNPVINHGEVDFRDPRRDKQHGRIWRISYKGGPIHQWEGLKGKSQPELLKKLLSENFWEKAQARQLLSASSGAELKTAVEGWLKSVAKGPGEEVARREAAWILSGQPSGLPEQLARSSDAGSVAIGVRELARLFSADRAMWTQPVVQQVTALLAHANPRVRLEAIRALPRVPTASSAAQLLAALPADGSDSFLEFAAWQSMNDLAKPWVESVLAGQWKLEGNEKQLEYGLNAIDPTQAAPLINSLLKDRPVAKDGAGPWIELAGKGGSPAELRKLLDAVLGNALEPKARQRALAALVSAARIRNAKPEGDLQLISGLFESPDRDLRAGAARLSGLWKISGAGPRLAELAVIKDAGLSGAAFEGLRSLGGAAAVEVLTPMLAANQPLGLRRSALVTLANIKLPAAMKELANVLSSISVEAEAVETWRGLLQAEGAFKAVQQDLPKNMPALVYAAGLKVARESGKKGADLAGILAPMAGTASVSPKDMAGAISGMVAQVKAGGDPAEGELVYRRSGCVQCHSIGGAGGKLGPDLSSLGASAPLDYSIESVLDPAAKVKEGYHAFAFTMKDGSQLIGIPTHETAIEQFIRPGPGPEMPLIKANIAKRENVGSLMPPGLVDALDFVSKRSLFAFLGELGKPGAFDASKGNVARVWWLYGDKAEALQAGAAGIAAQTLVDGRLLRDLVKPLAEMVGKTQLYAAARFELAVASQKPLQINGVKTAWLDGQPLALDAEGRSKQSLSVGAHSIVVELEVKQLPDAIKIQCDDARFIGD